jgi:thiosulfate/3-mercaptopyruvate sulfurtransferase
MMHPFLIDTATLDQNLGREGLVIIDVRGKAAYAFGGHIPGAVNATWHEFSDPDAAAKGLLDPDTGRLERKLRALGINNDSDVVIYSNPFDNWGDEGRMFWMLQYLGHQKLRILDGGWVKWTKEQRKYEHFPVTPKPGTFTAKPDPGLIIGKEELKPLVRQPTPGLAIADARSLEEYAGKEISGIPRAGHIPGALSIPWNAFLNPDATLKEADAIRAGLADRGLQPGQSVVCYCTGGVRSSWLYVVLKLVGYGTVRNYPGSWWEWSRDFAAPVEKDTKLLYKIVGSEEGKPS